MMFSQAFPRTVQVSVLALSIVAASPVRADDSSEGVVLPGWRSEPIGSVDVYGSSVVLAGRTARVSIQIRNRSDVPVRLAIAAPRFGYVSPAETYSDRHFPELGAALNERPIEIKSETRVYVDGSDVTKGFTRNGVDPYTVTLEPPELTASTPKAVLDDLSLMGAVAWDSPRRARWSVERLISIDLPKGPRARFDFSYTVLPAFHPFSLTEPNPPFDSSPYCLDMSELYQRLDEIGPLDGLEAWEYRIPAGIDGYTSGITTVTVGPPGDREEGRVFIAVCGANQWPVTAFRDLPPTVTRVGPDGTVRILVVTAAPPLP